MSGTKIEGRLTKILYKSGEYHVCLVENETLTANVIINQENIKPGLIAEFIGEWGTNKKYGEQFKCTYFIEKLPNTRAGFIGYLKSDTFKGIGDVTAKRIVDFLGADPLSKLKEDVNVILSVPKVKKTLLESIKQTWVANTVKAEITILLQQHGINGVNVSKIYEKFGAASINTINKNPYTLIYCIKGIGFKQADRIAESVGIEADSELRVVECLKYVIENNSTYGSCYLTESQVTYNVIELIGSITKDRIRETLVNINDIKKITIDGEDRYYSKSIYYAENSVLMILKDMVNMGHDMGVYDFIDDTTLSDEQKDAVFGCLSNKISILTGGPGCGKTYTTKTIINTLNHMGKSFAICAPTGKAAMRSTEVIGHKATTIHRFLEFDPVEFGFVHNYHNKLKYDYIIVEESSMIDIKLMASLLEAVDDHTQILFVGDKDQLSPVGAGSPFKDMIQSDIIPTYRLNKIFRQAMSSKIITHAHKINNGESVYIESPLADQGLWKSSTDCMFIDSDFDNGDKIVSTKSTLYYGHDIVYTIKRLFTETIKKFRGYDDVQILIPKRIGNLGVNSVNKIIQDCVNPISNFSQQIVFKDKQFRLNDKVIHTQNNYNLGGGVFNGEIGKITQIDIVNGTCVVSYPNRDIKYKKQDMQDLDLAFAITIHKSQGSEFDCVILPMLPEYGIMLERSLVYTALTRAKKLAIFVGQRQSLIKSIMTVNTKKRQTSLCELLVNDNLLITSS